MGLFLKSLAMSLVMGVNFTLHAQVSESLLAKATTEMRAGQLKEASQTVRQFLKQNPKSSRGWALSGFIHLRMKETMVAIVEFTKAIKTDPTPEASLYVTRARAIVTLPLDKVKNIDRAISSLREGIKKIGESQEISRYLEDLESQRKALVAN